MSLLVRSRVKYLHISSLAPTADGYLLELIKGPLKYLLRLLLGNSQFAVTRRIYACLGPNLDNVY